MTRILPLEPISARAEQLFDQQKHEIHVRTDHLFAWLMPIQWIAGIIFALSISPTAWSGQISSIHPHIWAAVFLGGAIMVWPVICAVRWPGSTGTRQVIAVGQMSMSALLIHLTGGRIETHFHIFGSLAFLAFYRDPRVLITASVVVAVDHFVRGVYFPLSVFGTLTASPYRSLEHVGWVVFEDIFLLISIRQSLRQMVDIAGQRASLEAVNSSIEQTVAERTAELTREIAHRKLANDARMRLSDQLVHDRRKFEQILDSIPVTVFENFLEGAGGTNFVNAYVEKMYGYTKEEWTATPDFWASRMHPEDRGRILPELAAGLAAGSSKSGIWRWTAKDGRTVWGETHVTPLISDGARLIGSRGIIIDITERKRAEAEMDRMNTQLIDASRQAGMAEVATNVLHNVGNVLNSVNISHAVISQKVHDSEIGNVAKASDLLQAHSGNLAAFLTTDPAGKKLPSFLSQLSHWLTGEQAAILSELDVLGRNIEHIKEVIAAQQNFAHAGGLQENLQIADLIENALRINDAGLIRDSVEIVRDYGDMQPVSLDKHKVLQILINLVSNAKHALSSSSQDRKRLVISAARDNGHLTVRVCDNGVGIARENFVRIFAHGFTTKKSGHGFGLHSSSLAAKDMGGSLAVASEGPGKGATFTLDLPVNGHVPSAALNGSEHASAS